MGQNKNKIHCILEWGVHSKFGFAGCCCAAACRRAAPWSCRDISWLVGSCQLYTKRARLIAQCEMAAVPSFLIGFGQSHRRRKSWGIRGWMVSDPEGPRLVHANHTKDEYIETLKVDWGQVHLPRTTLLKTVLATLVPMYGELIDVPAARRSCESWCTPFGTCCLEGRVSKPGGFQWQGQRWSC